jgi:uncharacterized protein YlaI
MGKGQFFLTIPCPGCETKVKVKTRKPHYHTPTITKYTCPTCDSRFLVSVEKTSEVGKFKVDSVPLAIGARLIEIQKTKAQLKNLAESPLQQPVPPEPTNETTQSNT